MTPIAFLLRRVVAIGAGIVLLASCASAPSPALSPDPLLAEGVPRLASGKPDFSGIWQTLSTADYDLEPHSARFDAPPGAGVVEGKQLPYLPEAQARREANFDERLSKDPRLKCWVLGVPRSVYFPAPFQILQREDDLTLLHQFGHQVRTIHANGSLHPDADRDLWLGDSRGRWEGDALLVDVVDFYDETWLDRSGNYHSTDLHVAERWEFVDKDTILYTATLTDPQVYSRPFTLSVHLHRHRAKDAQIIEDYCFTLPYDEFYPHRDGAQ